ncbi:coiled-coil-helix-coiled-coil-helix domain-containing protein 2-like [Dreissena polymorpha]|nr:coiled-coil-helix-coiled-coil-helix domain-containing protein 2-like [Dreissena polymorpha]
MPRRRSSPAPSPSRAPAPPPRQTAPAPAPQHYPPAQVQPKQPGLLANMAATAGGVAAGSVIGHGISHAIWGGSGSSQQQAPAPVQQYQPPAQQQQQPSACQYELDQFLNCSKQQSDLQLCYGFNEALKECKMRYNMP